MKQTTSYGNKPMAMAGSRARSFAAIGSAVAAGQGLTAQVHTHLVNPTIWRPLGLGGHSTG